MHSSEILVYWHSLMERNEQDVMPALYSEGMVVLAQGEMKGGIFVVSLLGPPKVESRESFFQHFPSFADEERFSGEVPESSTMIVLCEIWLDRPAVRQKLRTLFEGYCANRFLPELFVLVGNFHSIPLDSLGTNTAAYTRGFEQLAEIISSFPLLSRHSEILLVPGPNDPFASGILPRRAIASPFVKSLAKLENVRFASNPCRIKFYGRDVVVHRDDLLGKIQRLALPALEPLCALEVGEELHAQYAQYILGQGHLSPLPLQVNPVYWQWDFSLRLDILPDAVRSTFRP